MNVPMSPIPSSHESSPVYRARAAAATPARVLVAEDDDEMRALIATSLRRDGYELIEACDGIQLVEHLRALRGGRRGAPQVELIISDIRMPGFTGLEMLAALRRDDWRTPVVLITAFGEREIHKKAHALGADVVLDKPLDLDDLRIVAQGLLSMRRA